MVASELLSYIDGFSVSKYSGLEDFADRANFQGNIIVLMISICIVSMRQYFMNPIICYIPTVPGGANAEDYITNMCWSEGTVPLNFTAKVPKSLADWTVLRKQRMNYYQWIPFVLGLQAVLYYLPRLLWQIITYNRTGMDLEQLVKDANDANSEDEDTKKKIIEHISRNIETMLYGHRRITPRKENLQNRVLRHVPGKRRGNLLVSFYFFIKILYIVIGFLQMYLMYRFLRLDFKEGYTFFGYRILYDILAGKEWTETQVFPRVGMCRHPLEQIAGENQAFAQCMLPINMLNEKIYIFLFFFLSAVLVLTILSLPMWIYRTVYRKSQRQLVKQCLRMNDSLDQWDRYTKHKVDRFVVEFLRHDGNFIVRMLSMNVGDLTTASVVGRLFEIYLADGYTKVDLRNRKKVVGSTSNDQFMQIPLQNMGCALKPSAQSSSPNEKLVFL